MKKTLILLLALMVLLSACTSTPAGDVSKPAESSETTQAGSTTTSEKSEEPIDPYRLAETVTVQTAKNVYDVNIYPEGQTPDANDVYKGIEEVMGIRFENKFAVPFDAYKQKIKLGMVSGDLPDIFTVDEQDLAELIRNDALEDLTPYYEQVATDNLKRVIEFNNKAAMAPSMRNGKMYGMPNMSDALNSVPVLWLRADWLKSLDMKAPTSSQELVDLAMAFAEKDPDGNGKKDTYGLALSNELDMRFTSFANMFGAYPRIYRNTNGAFTYGSIEPAVKDALKEMAGLYAAGAIDPEFATKDLSKMAETVSQGKVGMFIGEFYSPLWPLVDSVKLIEGAEWTGIRMPGADYKPHVRINAMGAHVVRKGAANPEAIMVYLNNVVEAGYENPDSAWSKKYAELSTTYVNNSVNNWMPMLFDLPDANASKLVKFKKADETGDASGLQPNQKNLYDLIQAAKNGDKTQWAWPKTYYEGVETAVSYQNLVYDAWYLPPTDTAKRNGASLKTLEETAFINIIAGSAPLDSFDGFCKDWAAQGGTMILEEMAEVIKN